MGSMAKTRVHIPQSGDDLTPAWFSETLDGKVLAVERSVIGAGIGFIGELHRCELTWADSGDGRPDSVVVKIPAVANHGIGEASQAYEREIVVYRELGGRFGIPMPEYHYSEFDPNPAARLKSFVLFLFEKLPVNAVNWLLLKFLGLSDKSRRRYLLMMEDIRDSRPPAQAVGGSIDDAKLALDVLAAFHAHNWMRREVSDVSDLFWPLEQTPKVWQAGYLRNREQLENDFGHLLSDAVLAKLDDVQSRIPEIMGHLGSAPWTMLHGDYRLDNILFRPSGELVVLDFQAVGQGRAGWDVAYFITTALTPDHRVEEESLLRRYHDALVSEGVSDYSYEVLIEDVELAKLAMTHRFIGGIDALDTQMADGDDTFLVVMIERILGWID